jgi:peptidoglycan/xylan/chitin deacetylase (PgdA/CDA1 family)
VSSADAHGDRIVRVSRRAAIRLAAAAAIGLSTTTACDDSARRAPAAGGSRASAAGTGPASASAPSDAASTSVSAGPGPGLGSLPPEISSGPRDRPQVALTFHGQGEAAQVRQILTELEAANARVTVLAVGTWLDAEPALARRILDGGHELGNHTQTHSAIAQMSADKAFAEIDACAQRLKKLTGSVGVWFRPSQTQHATATIEAQAARVGYRTCLSYDVDSRDYTDPGSAAVVRNTLRSIQNGSIVSLHFGHAGTVPAIAGIVDGLRQRSLRPVTMTGLMS